MAFSHMQYESSGEIYVPTIRLREKSDELIGGVESVLTCLACRGTRPDTLSVVQ